MSTIWTAEAAAAAVPTTALVAVRATVRSKRALLYMWIVEKVNVHSLHIVYKCTHYIITCNPIVSTLCTSSISSITQYFVEVLVLYKVHQEVDHSVLFHVYLQVDGNKQVLVKRYPYNFRASYALL